MENLKKINLQNISNTTTCDFLIFEFSPKYLPIFTIHQLISLQMQFSSNRKYKYNFENISETEKSYSDFNWKNKT